MAAAQACDGDVWLACLPYACSARRRAHVGFAPGADAAPEFAWNMNAVPAGYLPGQGGVALRPLGVCSLEALGECEEYSYSFVGYSSGVVGHRVSTLGLGESGRVYKSWVAIFGGKRGRAARLARGAHNPKVGSSNLPPATKNHEGLAHS